MTAITKYALSVADEDRVSSQNGEDGVIAAIVDRVGGTHLSFVEIGAGDGSEGNCVALADAGWTGLFVEADVFAYRGLLARWENRPKVVVAKAHVTAENVEAVLGQVGVEAEPTLMSFDIDGNDYWVWAALVQYRPLVVVVEYNAALSGVKVQPYNPEWKWDRTRFFGASLAALDKLARAKGYAFVYAESSGTNAFFVRDDVATMFETPAALPEIVPAHTHPPDGLRREFVTP